MMLPSWGCIQRSWIVFTSPMFSKRRVESKDAFVHQFSAKRDRIGIVDRQHSDRGATDASSAYEDRAIPLKMSFPALESRMKESHEFSCERINPGDVRAFVLVAVQATPGTVLQNGQAAVLLGDDMVELKRKRIDVGGQMTIVTTIASQLTDVINQLPLHGSTARRL